MWTEDQWLSRDPPGPQLDASWSEYLLGSQLLQNVGTHCWATQPIT